MGARGIRLLVAAAALSSVLGCSQFHAELNDFATKFRDKAVALKAWCRAYPNYKGEVYYVYDFGDGYQTGYIDVMAGRLACPPTLPPQKYWCLGCQSATGKARIDAWFQGYEAGALAADAEGVRGQNYVHISPFRRMPFTNSMGYMTPVPTDLPLPPIPSPKGATDEGAADGRPNHGPLLDAGFSQL